MPALVRYEQARTALAECARIDEASEVRDKAAALAAYARQRDDRELEVWVREIHLRACVRIGELSRELERADHGGSGGGSKFPAVGISKAQALAAAHPCGLRAGAHRRHRPSLLHPRKEGRRVMAHELRIHVTIPLDGDAMARAKDVAAFEPTLDAFAEAVVRAGGDISVDVVKAKPRAAKQEAH